jgi:hypothetical protein
MGTSPFAAVNHYLQIDEPDEKHQWNLSLQTGQIGDLQFGYQPRASLADWRESLFYLTDGEAIKFSIKKVTPRSGGTGRIKGFVVPTEEAESHWFTSAGTGPQH